jgi:hypothetical protein
MIDHILPVTPPINTHIPVHSKYPHAQQQPKTGVVMLVMPSALAQNLADPRCFPTLAASDKPDPPQ